MRAQPTLVRRVVLALMLAFGLIFALNLAVIYWQVTDQGRLDARLGARAERLLVSLDGASSAGEARMLAAAVGGMLNQSAGDAPALANPRAQRPSGVLMVLSDAAGTPLYRSAGPSWTPPVAGRAADVVADGRSWRAYRAASPRWSVALAEEKFAPAALLLRISRDMGFYLLVSFVLVLGAIWLAVSSGLRPLRELSETISARSADDLQPLGVSAVHAELTPLTSSIDRLLAQLRSKMETERGFVQDAAHELRTPLAVISAQAHVLATAPAGEQRAGAGRDMDRAIGRASRLIRQLLALAQADSAPAAAAKATDVAQLVRQELASLAPAAMHRGVDLSLESPDTLLHQVDAHALQSIVQNLVSNAIEYVDSGGQVLVDLRAREGTLTLSVCDDGPGIAPEDQPHIFERFRRGAGQQSVGSGLGLAIVRQAAARMNGSVRLGHGLDGKGCGFVVDLPSAERS
jgi:two-component system sensor histidine kinase QseC